MTVADLIPTLFNAYKRGTGRDVTHVGLGTLEHGQFMDWLDAQGFVESSPDVVLAPGEVLYMGRRVSLVPGLAKGVLLRSVGNFPLKKPEY